MIVANEQVICGHCHKSIKRKNLSDHTSVYHPDDQPKVSGIVGMTNILSHFKKDTAPQPVIAPSSAGSSSTITSKCQAKRVCLGSQPSAVDKNMLPWKYPVIIDQLIYDLNAMIRDLEKFKESLCDNVIALQFLSAGLRDGNFIE